MCTGECVQMGVSRDRDASRPPLDGEGAPESVAGLERCVYGCTGGEPLKGAWGWGGGFLQLHILVKTHQNVCLKWVNFTVGGLFFNISELYFKSERCNSCESEMKWTLMSHILEMGLS